MTDSAGNVAPYGLREDGTPKGRGFFGLLPSQAEKGKVVSELSADAEVNGRRLFFPLLVPTLTREQIDLLVSGKEPTAEIYEKAIQHAQARIRSGKSPFAAEGEQGAAPPSAEDAFREGFRQR